MKFLEQIADYYTDGNRPFELSDCVFIFPNQRSALFFKHYIHKRMTEKFALMPRFITFSQFASYTSGVPETSKLELLFILYKTYVEVAKSCGAEVQSFDRFIFWGDMILNDFDVIDSSLADAEKVYKNLKDLKEISADYLTDEQKEVIERIWGPTLYTQHLENFWHHMGEKEMACRFVAWWEILGRVYVKFRERLNASGGATPGMQIRKAAEIIKNTAKAELERKHYVFVGLADVSNAEFSIMLRMKNAGCADFFWDVSSPTFYNKGKLDTTNPALSFISRMIKEFKHPDDFNPEPVDELGRINIYGVASSVMQTKLAGELIGKMELDENTAFETAIVLPNASQLIPLMLSLPERKYGVNITMGLPYTSTNFSTLLSAIIAMQRHSTFRSGDGARLYYYKDVLEVLLNPHIQLIAPGEANVIRQYIHDNKLSNIDANSLVEHFPVLAFIFSPMNEKKGESYTHDVDSSYVYVAGLLEGLRSRIEEKADNYRPFELEILSYFENKVKEMKEFIDRFDIDMKESTFLSLFERIMFGASIEMEGTPLKGMQIMGVLETRCLDFDNIMFLSMNEEFLPRKRYVRTMIPNSLRLGYGLPTIRHTESFYSYYFFRAISRAKNVYLLYDTRSPGSGRGEISRFVEQLLTVYKTDKISSAVVSLDGTIPPPREIVVQKSKRVMEQLERYKNPNSHKNISASALKTYLECPLHFYLRYVNDLGDDKEPVEFLDAAAIGEILHGAAELIYKNNSDGPITAAVYDKILASNEIERALISETARQLGVTIDDNTTVDDLNNVEATLIIENLKMEIESMLMAEKEKYCSDGGYFSFLKGELDIKGIQWTVGNHTFNVHMKIDRIDRLPDNTLRFIDYKTGRDNTTFTKIEDLFKGDHSVSGIFQLLAYGCSYCDLAQKVANINCNELEENEDLMWMKKNGVPSDITFSLYSLRELMKSNVLQDTTQGKVKLRPLSALRNEFEPLLIKTIDDIFNNTTPFGQCSDIARCRFCDFKSVCGRQVAEEL